MKEIIDTMIIDELNVKAFNHRYTNTNEALEIAEKARKLSIAEAYQYGEIVSQLNIAIVQFLTSSAENTLESMLEIIEDLNKYEPTTFHVAAYNFTGNAYDSIGEYHKGLEYCYKALEYAIELEYVEGEGDTLSTMGLIYMRLCDYDKAIDSFEKSLKIREANGNILGAASSYNLLGRTNVLFANYEKAEAYYLKSIDIRKENRQQTALPWSYLGLASMFEKKGDSNSAIRYYLQAIEVNEHSGDQRCNLQCYLGLGRLELLSHQLLKGEDYLYNALKIAVELKAKPLQSEIYYSLSDLEEKKGNFDSSLDFFRKYHQLREEISNTESLNRLKNKEIGFAIEQKKKEAEIYQLRNIELKKAYNELDEKTREITDSIQYASRIQNAVLPNVKILNDYFREYFLLFKPKDIVSGDFYWLKELNDEIIIVAADCTGHGVPGALMTIMGTAFLDEICNDTNLIANEILDRLRNKIIHKLEQPENETQQKDGMDIALIKFNRKSKEIQFAGAYNPLLIIRNGEIEVIKADRMPVGKYHDNIKDFSLYETQLSTGDQLVIFSDGYIDQFGGDDNRKFMIKNFKELLLSIQHLPLTEQHIILEEEHVKWRGQYAQIDDIIVLSLKI